MYDVIIIGAGVTGCAVARYLSRYQSSALVLERAEDVCCGTSKANSAIIHAGFDAAHGSLMAKMNVQGNRMVPGLAKELDFPFRMNGSLVVCMSEEDMPRLQALYENGVKNGVEGLEIVDARRLHELEPNVSKNAVAALWAPTGGIVCPFNMTIALAENANANGVDFRFNTRSRALPGARRAGPSTRSRATSGQGMLSTRQASMPTCCTTWSLPGSCTSPPAGGTTACWTGR